MEFLLTRQSKSHKHAFSLCLCLRDTLEDQAMAQNLHLNKEKKSKFLSHSNTHTHKVKVFLSLFETQTHSLVTTHSQRLLRSQPSGQKGWGWHKRWPHPWTTVSWPSRQKGWGWHKRWPHPWTIVTRGDHTPEQQSQEVTTPLNNSHKRWPHPWPTVTRGDHTPEQQSPGPADRRDEVDTRGDHTPEQQSQEVTTPLNNSLKRWPHPWTTVSWPSRQKGWGWHKRWPHPWTTVSWPSRQKGWGWHKRWPHPWTTVTRGDHTPEQQSQEVTTPLNNSHKRWPHPWTTVSWPSRQKGWGWHKRWPHPWTTVSRGDHTPEQQSPGPADRRVEVDTRGDHPPEQQSPASASWDVPQLVQLWSGSREEYSIPYHNNNSIYTWTLHIYCTYKTSFQLYPFIIDHFNSLRYFVLLCSWRSRSLKCYQTVSNRTVSVDWYWCWDQGCPRELYINNTMLKLAWHKYRKQGCLRSCHINNTML